MYILEVVPNRPPIATQFAHALLLYVGAFVSLVVARRLWHYNKGAANYLLVGVHLCTIVLAVAVSMQAICAHFSSVRLVALSMPIVISLSFQYSLLTALWSHTAQLTHLWCPSLKLFAPPLASLST